MKTESYLPWRSHRLTLIVLALGFLAVCSVAPAPDLAEAGTLTIPAWAFDRGNVRINANPDEFADAGAVVVSGQREPWGWRVEYEVDFPVAGSYRLYIKFASAEARPLEVYYDTRNISKTCVGVSLDSAGKPSWKSSSAKWELLRSRFGGPDPVAARRNGKATAGKHTITLTSLRPLPHLVALRLETPEAFPADWTPPKFKTRDIETVPAKYRKTLAPRSDVDVAAMRKCVKDPPRPRSAGSLMIPAWAFDRGNVRIYASPDKYANAGPLIGGDSGQPDGSMVEYDIDFPVDGKYTLQTQYASAQARPLEVLLDGKPVGWCCNGVAFNSPPFELPIVLSDDSWDAKWDPKDRVTMSVTKGKHTLKLARKGAFPHLVALKLNSSAPFPKGWKQPPRVMRQFDSIPVRLRSVFLPPNSVNIGALRLAIADTIKTYGAQYPGGEDYLKQLTAFEKKPNTVSVVRPVRKSFLMGRTWAGEENIPVENRKAENELKSLRQKAMLAHPALKFDKLLFIKRNPYGGHIYEDQHNGGQVGNIYILSPVSPDGKVTKLVPELDGGTFGRFDLSFDTTRVIFCYKKPKPQRKAKKKGAKQKREPNSFHIYEIRLDPSTGRNVPGSLRQLTFGGPQETQATNRAIGGRDFAFHDTDPCYLPDGKIIFVSARSQRNVFCFGTTVSSLHIMDADGKNMRCLSQGPLTEMGPTLLNDGRVVYTRWEYVDKGLGNGQSVWAVRPDGSGVDHVFKNSTMRPSGMIHTRGIPGSRLFVTVANPHCGRNGGAVVLIDNRETRRSIEAMTSITPELSYPCMYHYTWHMGYFLTPYPFSEKFFLVSHQPGVTGREASRYGIYALDAWGNRAKIHEDPELSCFEPMPLRPRRRPMQIASVEKPAAGQGKTGTLFIQNVYDGLTGIERGRVKYVRVMGALPWLWSEAGMFRLGLAGNVHRKKVYGVAKVHEDGSAYFTAPADENIFFQVLDENFMQLQHMPTFINMMPGESRSCIGCHEHRRKAPGMARVRPLAMKYPARKLSPQPGDTGPRMVHYASDVQTVLDKHCVGCHSGANPKGRLDLTGAPTDTWNRSYENIMGKGLVSSRQCGFGRSGFRPQAPLSFGSHLSRLTGRIRKAPCKANITQGEFVRVVTWIDANTPYYGTYRGKRGIQHKNEPDFRPPPLAAK